MQVERRLDFKQKVINYCLISQILDTDFSTGHLEEFTTSSWQAITPLLGGSLTLDDNAK